jgi:hypothetical protein
MKVSSKEEKLCKEVKAYQLLFFLCFSSISLHENLL